MAIAWQSALREGGVLSALRHRCAVGGTSRDLDISACAHIHLASDPVPPPPHVPENRAHRRWKRTLRPISASGLASRSPAVIAPSLAKTAISAIRRTARTSPRVIDSGQAMACKPGAVPAFQPIEQGSASGQGPPHRKVQPATRSRHAGWHHFQGKIGITLRPGVIIQRDAVALHPTSIAAVVSRTTGHLESIISARNCISQSLAVMPPST